jgi:hypothetical protein
VPNQLNPSKSLQTLAPLQSHGDHSPTLGFGFVRHANMVAAGALMTTRTFVSPELIRLVATTMNW